MLDALEEDEEVAADSAEVSTETESEEASQADELSSDQTEVQSEGAVTNSSSSSQSSSGTSQSTSSSTSSDSSASSAQSETQATEAQTTARTYKADGTYSASATVEDYAYPIVVTITISNDKIVSAVANYNAAVTDEDYTCSEKAASGLSASGYSAVSGATYSSEAIKSAYNAAVAKAKN